MFRPMEPISGYSDLGFPRSFELFSGEASLILLLSPFHHLGYKDLFSSYRILKCVHLNCLVSSKLKVIIGKEGKEEVRGCSSCKGSDVRLNPFFLLTSRAAEEQLEWHVAGWIPAAPEQR